MQLCDTLSFMLCTKNVMHNACKKYSSCLYYSVNALARLVSKIADEEFASTGLAPSHAFLVMTVNERPGIQPGEIADMMQLAPSTVTRFIDKMADQGLLLRTIDGKNVYILPTQQGKKIDTLLRSAQARLTERLEHTVGMTAIGDLTSGLWHATQAFAVELHS